MKKIFLILALICFYTASAQNPFTDSYTIHNIDGREYKRVDYWSTIIFYRTSTWQVEGSATHLNGKYFTESEALDLIKFKIKPPVNFDLKMNQFYEQALSILERESVKGAELKILLYLDPVTGNVEGMEFEFEGDEDYHRFNDIPLEKWAKFDKLIMDANFTFTIPPELKDANYETYRWYKTGENKVEREDVYLFCTIVETSNENTSGILKLPVSSPVNGNRELYSGDPVTFVISSPSKGFKIYLKQCNYDLAKLSLERDPTPRDSMRFDARSISSEIYYTFFRYETRYIDEELLKMTKEEAWEWAEIMKEKNVIIVSDRFEPYSYITDWKGGHRVWDIRDIWTNKP